MKSIVFVEDNIVMQHVYSILSIQNNWKIFQFSNINNLRYNIDFICPDAIVTDILLPDTNASELLTIYKEIKVPIIVTSCMDEYDTKYFTNAVGGLAYLKKPFNPDVLITLVNDI